MAGSLLSRFFALVLAGFFASLSHAATVGTFNFDNDAAFTTTPFTDQSNGISATFTSPSDPGGFIVAPSIFNALTGNVLGSLSSGANRLDVSFNTGLVDATFVFATADFGPPQPIDVEALYNGTPIGTATATGAVPNGFTFPEGEIAFAGQAFNQLVIAAPDSPAFAIDSLAVAQAPEPSAVSLLLLGLFAIGVANILRASRMRRAASKAATLALSISAMTGIAGAATPSILPLPAQAASTVPSNGDVNPYGVAFVPKTVATGGILTPGSILVSNFNNSNNLQGFGTTIVEINRDGSQTPFFTSSQTMAGMTAALGIFPDGLVLCGYLPTLDGTAATAQPGGIEILSRYGRLSGVILNPNIANGPWGMAISEKTPGAAQVFVSNVLTGTIVRLDVQENGSSLSISKTTTIAAGLDHRPDPAALELGPSGLAYDSAHDVLYFANSEDNSISSITGAGAATGELTPVQIVQDFTHLHGPLNVVLAPTGHLLVANSDGSNVDPNQPSELVEYTTGGQFVAQFSVDPNNGGAFGMALVYSGFSTVTLAAVDDNQNVLRIWTEALQ